MLAMIEQYTEAWDELTAPGAQFATTTIEVRGAPIKVFESALPSMRSVWEMARGYGDRDYVVYEDERYTFAEADAIIRALAAGSSTSTASSRAIGWRSPCGTIRSGCSATGP